MAADLSAPSVCITSGIKNTESIENEIVQMNKSLSEILELADYANKNDLYISCGFAEKDKKEYYLTYEDRSSNI